MNTMLQKTLKKHTDKLRFGAVGIINTSLDFGLLFLLVNLAQANPLFGNLVSTSIAFVFSFFANKKYTFRLAGSFRSEAPKFIVVTLFGLWVIQPVIINATMWLMNGLSLDSNVVLFIEKLSSNTVTLVWNYVLYKKLVFKEEK
jgi:putative flippase GtrA